MSAAQVCKPNISAAGRRRRQMFGYVSATITVGLFVAFASMHVAWWWRTLVFLPAALSATGFLQARRNTCIAHASKGTFEHDDFSATPAPADEVAASRVVAAGIRRDAVIAGFACAALAVASAYVI